MMDDGRTRDTGRLALATGLVAVGSAVCLGTYFAVGGPFGTINDVGNAATGVLSGVLAWRMRRQVTGGVGAAAVGAAVVGAVITVAGSSLVVSGTTGFLFAGLVSSVGFAGIGAWLIVLNRSRDQIVAWPGALRTVGVIAGALMAAGIVTMPAIPARYDDMDTAPGWIWIGFVSWFGIYVVYPAWAIAIGRFEIRRAGSTVSLPTGTVPE
jgi:hypothetical protein